MYLLVPRSLLYLALRFFIYFIDLPTVKVWNMLDDYGEDTNDKYPAKYAGKAQHERSNLMLTDLQHPVRTNRFVFHSQPFHKILESMRLIPKSSGLGWDRFSKDFRKAYGNGYNFR